MFKWTKEDIIREFTKVLQPKKNFMDYVKRGRNENSFNSQGKIGQIR